MLFNIKMLDNPAQFLHYSFDFTLICQRIN